MEIKTLTFCLPEDQDRYDAAVEALQLRQIIFNMEHYLGCFPPEQRLKAGRSRQMLLYFVNIYNLNCISSREDPPDEDKETSPR